jgi:hypothetical protein
MKKDIIRKIIASILSLWGIALLGYYFQQNVAIAKEYVAAYNAYVLIGLIVVFLAFFLHFGIVLFTWKWLKARAIVLGLLLIVASHYFVGNDVTNKMYAWDAISVIWVAMIFLTLWGLIVTKQAQQKLEQSKQVIIEV